MCAPSAFFFVLAHTGKFCSFSQCFFSFSAMSESHKSSRKRHRSSSRSASDSHRRKKESKRNSSDSDTLSQILSGVKDMQEQFVALLERVTKIESQRIQQPLEVPHPVEESTVEDDHLSITATHAEENDILSSNTDGPDETSLAGFVPPLDDFMSPVVDVQSKNTHGNLLDNVDANNVDTGETPTSVKSTTGFFNPEQTTARRWVPSAAFGTFLEKNSQRRLNTEQVNEIIGEYSPPETDACVAPLLDNIAIMAAGLYFVFSSFLIFYSIFGVILAQRSHLINYEVLTIEDVYGFAKDGQCLDSYNSILQICLSDQQVKRISKCKSSLLIPKSMKHSVVSLAFPTKFAVMDVTMYMAISFNLGFDLPLLCKHMKSDKANDILCSMCLTDNNYNNKIKYSCDHLLLSQEPASFNLLSLTNLKHCGVTTGLAVRYNGIQARFYKSAGHPSCSSGP